MSIEEHDPKPEQIMHVSSASASVEVSPELLGRADAQRPDGPRGRAWGRRAREAGAGPGEVAQAVRRLKADAFERSSEQGAEVQAPVESEAPAEAEAAAPPESAAPPAEAVAESQAGEAPTAPVAESGERSDPAPDPSGAEPAPVASPTLDLGFYGYARLAVELSFQLDRVA